MINKHGTYKRKNSDVKMQAIISLIAFFVISVFVGLLATTANPIYIVLGMGAISSIFIMRHPSLNLWLILILGLLFVGIVPLWTEGVGTKISWLVSILGFVMLFSALFSLLVNQKSRKNTPAFVWVALAFLIYCLIVGLINWDSSVEYISGVKRYFQVISLLFAFSWIGFSELQVSRWLKFMVFVVLAQLPWCLYELLILVPVREGVKYAYPGMVPVDVVAGTFGASLHGGGASGDMAIFLVIVIGFILAQLNEPNLKKQKLLYFLPFAFIPLFLGETKIVVIILPIMFLLIYRKELLRRPVFALFSIFIGGLLTFTTIAAYSIYHKDSIDSSITDTVDYNLQDTGYGGNYLNRTTVLGFWAANQGLDDPVGFILGHGIGSAHSSTGGHVAVQFLGYGIDLNTASTLLWEQGSLGTLLFIYLFISAWNTAGKLSKTIENSVERAHAYAIQSALPILLINLIYRVSFLENLPFQVLFYLMLGYLSHLWKKHNN